MKSFFCCLIIISIHNSVLPQTIKHHSYMTHYNADLKEPDSVSWDLTPEMEACVKHKRKDKFAQDPEIPNCASPKDYKVNIRGDRVNQIDAGHLFNYEEANCDSIDRIECFYISNMLPQYHSFNTGDWKRLEIKEQKWAKTTILHIIAGGIGSQGKLPNGENIPQFMWKAIYMNGQWYAWIMPNIPSSKGHVYTTWMVDIKKLESESGLKL
jgi:DNA/RNA endonuclease G (NUC1)